MNAFIPGRRPKGGDFGAYPSAKRQDGPGTGSVFGRPVGQTPILQSAPNGSDGLVAPVTAAKVYIIFNYANTTKQSIATITKTHYICGISV